MGLSLETTIPAFTVFLQGIISFFSPCVLPLVPLYIGYLAGGTNTVDPDGTIHYQRKKILVNTLFFIIGVSFAFFLLGFGFTAAGQFFGQYRTWFARIGGILVILFGLYQLGVFGSDLLTKEHRLPFRLNQLAMNPLLALVMGFTFSFAWTPCVGPALASVLLMASSASSSGMGFALIGIYTLGFVIPFLAVGLFTGTLLDFFKKHQAVVRYTVKIGGILMVLMGVMMLTGWMNGITGYLSQFGGTTTQPAPAATSQPTGTSAPAPTPKSRTNRPAIDFTLTDQYGNQHTLSEYKGKVVFLNFWMTWCGPCRQEMPDIQALYEKYGQNTGDVIILGVANPKTDEYPFNGDVTEDEVKQVLRDNGFTYPVVMDTTGAIFSFYNVNSYPTTFMIDTNGDIFGYVPGMLTSSMMEDIIQQTIQASQSN